MSYLLAFLLLCIFLSNAAGDSCADGFMDLNLLETKAATPVGSLAYDTLAESSETRWIITDNGFMCNNVRMTGILIGVDIRTKSDKRYKYPSIEVWYKSSNNNNNNNDNNNNNNGHWNRLSSVPIRLSPTNFTTNGLYRYVLPTSVDISNNYRIGVYQPEDDKSLVRFYKAMAQTITNVGQIKPNAINKTSVTIHNNQDTNEINTYDTTNVIMMHPITGIITHSIMLILLNCRPKQLL